ncbi:phosphoenolpyruvate--protein phosphotransferase [Protaetiibacter intestinalis]|uniref:Phosphocarrier protein HPr n=1 Tax=Protaetiibacter intestinalis TaxID=2419774 RepID=A0A387B1V4_9MICO|nr:phosphoenolpyruvate--protein phosphotransferase [Protaetiibacter intestinalis]AYF97482.1 phosphoenolpyruvate--protein phosphotransferase [Protaetiibacter intestinalis]
MIGIVIVSHSAALAEAAVQLAHQMVQGDRPQIVTAAGAGSDADGAPILGTDATRVAAAVDELAADGAEGVLLLMDLGSAVLSSELALELRSSDVPVRLAAAPFVEGLLAATVAAAGGASLDAVAAEASSALAAKASQLGDAEAPAEAPASTDEDAIVRRVTLRNRLGIHARPASVIAGIVGPADAQVTARRLPHGVPVQAGSMTGLLSLGAAGGDEVEFRASGPEAASVLDAIDGLVADGFGEDDAGPRPAAEAAVVTDVGPASVADGLLHGRGVSGGLAAAPVVRLGAPVPEPEAGAPLDAGARETEAARIGPAASAVADGLRSRARLAAGEAAAILEATALIALDPELASTAETSVRERGLDAARAVWEAAAGYEQLLASLGGRMAERASDIRDVRDRIVATLQGLEPPGIPQRDDPFVLVARDLAPADTVTLSGSGCVALVTELGGPTSHTAIIARALGLPAVVGAAGATGLAESSVVVVDGSAGTIDPHPDAAELERARARVEVVAFDGAGVTADGIRIPLLANVGSAADAEAGAAAHAEGVGLFRTEFCFLDRRTAPGVDEQEQAYAAVIAPFDGRKVVVRTLDAGADKPLPFANDDEEENPALGVRGLRVARRNPALLDDQLAALARATTASAAEIQVMAPMVATVDEARSFAERCRAAGLPTVGVMIETPSAALLAAEILDVVDFVSLGTNDLTQYTMAADRLLSELGELGDTWQPAVLRLIGVVGAAGAKAGKAVGVCGEAGGDPELAPVLVGLGATSLSMSPRALGPVAARLARLTLADCRRAAEAAAASETAAAARAAAAAVLADAEAASRGRLRVRPGGDTGVA